MSLVLAALALLATALPAATALPTAPASAPPDWVAPAPGAFSETMSVVGVVQVEGVELRSSSDRVAAFVDGQVRGVATPTLVGSRRIFYLSVAGEATDGTVVFRAYDATADRVYDLTPERAFTPLATYGTTSSPLVWTPVSGSAPPWTTPTTYAASMTVVAQVLQDGVDIAEAGAKVAAFVGGELRGVATLTLVSTYGYRALVQVKANTGESGTVTFRVYRPSAEQTFGAAETVALATGTSVGSVASPVALTLATGQTLTGGAGWRTLAPAGVDVTADYLLGPLWTQGFSGADVSDGDPTVYRYDEPTGTFVVVGAASDVWARGSGRAVYVFADDDPTTAGVQGGPGGGGSAVGFPKTLPSVGLGASGPFTFALTRTPSNGEPAGPGWNFLGNPFDEAIDWDTGWTRSGVGETVYVWDPAYLGGSYRMWNGTEGSLTGGVIPPGNAFWVEATGATPTLTVTEAAKVGTAALYGRTASADVRGLRLLLTSDDRPALGAELFVSFDEAASSGLDAADAHALASLAADHLRLGSVVEGRPLSIDVRPLDGSAEIPLAVGAVEGGAVRAEHLRLSWPDVALPPGVRARLVDRQSGTQVDLTTRTDYAFETDGSDPAGTTTRLAAPAQVALRRAGGDAPRFAVVISGPTTASEPSLESVIVSPLAPNPTSGRTTVRLVVPGVERVHVAVFDALGRRVAEAFDGNVAGASALAVDASSLSAGVYVVRVEGETFSASRRLTVAR